MDLQIVAFYFFAHEVLKASHLSDILKQSEESGIRQEGSLICRSDPRSVSMNTAPSDQIDRLKSLLAEFPILQVVSVYN